MPQEMHTRCRTLWQYTTYCFVDAYRTRAKVCLLHWTAPELTLAQKEKVDGAATQGMLEVIGESQGWGCYYFL